MAAHEDTALQLHSPLLAASGMHSTSEKNSHRSGEAATRGVSLHCTCCSRSCSRPPSVQATKHTLQSTQHSHAPSSANSETLQAGHNKTGTLLRQTHTECHARQPYRAMPHRHASMPVSIPQSPVLSAASIALPCLSTHAVQL